MPGVLIGELLHLIGLKFRTVDVGSKQLVAIEGIHNCISLETLNVSGLRFQMYDAPLYAYSNFVQTRNGYFGLDFGRQASFAQVRQGIR